MMAGRVRTKPTIHLLSVASSCKDLLGRLECGGTSALIRFVQEAVGERYRVTGIASLIEAIENDQRGGRRDDAARARDIQRTFADDNVVAAVALRGGSWLTRILNRIDFDVLKKRRKPLALFGFSELTPLVNIAARFARVRAYYDLTPGFLLPAMTHYARRHVAGLSGGMQLPSRARKEAPGRPDLDEASADAFASGWATGRFRSEFAAFFKDVVSIIEGRGSCRSLTGRLVRGKLPRRTQVIAVGGNLTLLMPMLASQYAKSLDPKGRWLAIEDFRETPNRIDRMLSALSLSGRLIRYEGILLGSFRIGQADYTEATLACLDQHLRGANTPVVILNEFGHIWPMSPLPLGRPFELQLDQKRRGSATVNVKVPWSSWSIVPQTKRTACD